MSPYQHGEVLRPPTTAPKPTSTLGHVPNAIHRPELSRKNIPDDPAAVYETSSRKNAASTHLAKNVQVQFPQRPPQWKSSPLVSPPWPEASIITIVEIGGTGGRKINRVSLPFPRSESRQMRQEWSAAKNSIPPWFISFIPIHSPEPLLVALTFRQPVILNKTKPRRNTVWKGSALKSEYRPIFSFVPHPDRFLSAV